jgi:HIRAN domain-containing protein
MEIVIVVLVVVLVTWALIRNRSRMAAGVAPRQRSAGHRPLTLRPQRGSAVRPATSVEPRQDPVAPHALTGRPSRLGARGRVSVVGESYRQAGIEFVVAGRAVADGGDWDNALRAEAALVPEPDNPYDGNAVRVDLHTPSGWVQVGYLARDLAAEYQPCLARMMRAGQVPIADARVCRARGGPLAVYLHLSEPEECVLANEVAAGLVVLGA